MVVLVVGSIFFLDQLIGDIVESLSQRFAIQQVANDRDRTMKPLLQELSLAKKLARTPDIISWAQDEDNPDKAKPGLATLERFRRLFRDGSYFFAVRKSGHYYFNNAEDSYAGQQLRYTLSQDNDKDDWFFATVKDTADCRLNVDYDREIAITNIWINCHVRHEGKVIGLIGTGIELTNYVQAVLDGGQDGVQNMFIDGDGAIQAHPDLSQIDFASFIKDEKSQNRIFELLDDAESTKRLKGMMARLKSAPERFETVELNIGGRKTLVGAAFLPEIDWFNLTLMNPRLWAVGNTFIPLAVLVVLGILLTLILTTLLIERTILQRIDRLDHAVAKVRMNDYNFDLDDGEQDEIGRLTSGFVEMAEGIRQNRRVLETEVAERTRELVDARDDAESANLAKSEFLAMMSHDLRTPLNAIIGFSSMMQKQTHGPFGDARYMAYLKDINDSGLLLLSLINVVLDISKIEAGKLDLIETEVNLAAFLKQSARLIAPQAEARSVSLTIECADDGPLLLCDQRPLSQIINNLISNAIKFSDAGQTVVVTAVAMKTRGYIIQVKDEGIGMDINGIEKALEPFSRASSNEARNQDGTGLGLYVSRLLMNQHGGSLKIDSSPGQGTTVTATFPPERIIYRT